MWSKVLVWLFVVLVGGGSGYITTKITSNGPIWEDGTELWIEIDFEEGKPDTTASAVLGNPQRKIYKVRRVNPGKE